MRKRTKLARIDKNTGLIEEYNRLKKEGIVSNFPEFSRIYPKLLSKKDIEKELRFFK